MALIDVSQDEAYLDSNVVFYSVIGDREFGEPCSTILEDIEDGTLRSLASVLVILEVTNAVRRIGRPAETERIAAAMASLPIRFLEVTEPLVTEGVRLARQAGCSPYDGVHAATMFDQGIPRILSTDKDFDRIRGIERIDPRTYVSP